MPQFFRGLGEIARSLSPSQTLFSHHFSSCRFLSTVHSLCTSSSASLSLCFPIWQLYCILHFCFKIHSFSPINATGKNAEIPQQPCLSPMVMRHKSPHQDGNGSHKCCCSLDSCAIESCKVPHMQWLSDTPIHTHTQQVQLPHSGTVCVLH